jgi:hypothetical protein
MKSRRRVNSTVRRLKMKVVASITLSLAIGAAVVCQVTPKPTAVPSRRLVTRGEMSGPLSEIYLDLAASAGKPRDRVALRICSSDPMPVALILAVVSPDGIATDLSQGINGPIAYSDRVFILRSPNCPVTHPPYVPVEFWGVPEGADMPSSVESLKPCQIKMSGTDWFDTTGRKRNAAIYRAALQELLATFREQNDGVVVVYGSYYVHPSLALRRSLKQTNAFFKQNHVPANRFYVRLKPSPFYDPAYPRPEPRYPNMVIVHVAKDCADNSTAANKSLHASRGSVFLKMLY